MIHNIYPIQIECVFLDVIVVYYLPMHTEVVGFGVHVPFGDIPSDVHTALILPAGTNPVLHLKSISAPPSALGTATMETLPGEVGITQLTGRKCSGNMTTSLETRNCPCSFHYNGREAMR